MGRLAAVALLVISGCFQPRHPIDHRIRVMIQSPDKAEREREFQFLANAPVEIIPNLKLRLQEGHAVGFPCVALLYNLGEGDAVPLELRVLHIAKFSWPARFADANKVLEPYVWNELLGDLRKAGKPALRLLGDALAREAPDEARAMRIVDVMLRVGGATPQVLFEEFARHLDVTRDLAGVRVCDIAGAALLHLSYQDVVLYRSTDLAAAAKARLDALRGAAEEIWINMGRSAATDAARDAREGATWSEYLKRLAADEENRVLERHEGVVLRRWTPRRTLWDLRVARWDPRPDPGLATKWRRWKDSRLLRLSISKIGPDPAGQRGVVFIHEKHFHCTEDDTATFEGQADAGIYQLFVQSLELGTRLVVSEFVVGRESGTGDTRHFDVDPEAPVCLFHPQLASGTVLLIEEVDTRAPPSAPDALKSKITKLCLKRLEADPAGASRALAYLGVTSACDEIAACAVKDDEARRAVGAALLILGDPRGLDLGVTVTLSKHERAMARAAAKDARLKAWLGTD